MLAAESVVHEPCVMIDADDFYGRDAFASIANHLSNAAPANGKSQYCMVVGFKLSNTLSEHGSVARGVCKVDDQGLAQLRQQMTTKIFDRPTPARRIARSTALTFRSPATSLCP